MTSEYILTIARLAPAFNRKNYRTLTYVSGNSAGLGGVESSAMTDIWRCAGEGAVSSPDRG